MQAHQEEEHEPDAMEKLTLDKLFFASREAIPFIHPLKGETDKCPLHLEMQGLTVKVIEDFWNFFTEARMNSKGNPPLDYYSWSEKGFNRPLESIQEEYERYDPVIRLIRLQQLIKLGIYSTLKAFIAAKGGPLKSSENCEGASDSYDLLNSHLQRTGTRQGKKIDVEHHISSGIATALGSIFASVETLPMLLNDKFVGNSITRDVMAKLTSQIFDIHKQFAASNFSLFVIFTDLAAGDKTGFLDMEYDPKLFELKGDDIKSLEWTPTQSLLERLLEIVAVQKTTEHDVSFIPFTTFCPAVFAETFSFSEVSEDMELRKKSNVVRELVNYIQEMMNLLYLPSFPEKTSL